MIIITFKNTVEVVNMHSHEKEKKVTAILNNGRGQSGAIILRLNNDSKVRVRFVDVVKAVFQERVYYSNILCNEDTFINVFVKGEQLLWQSEK